MCDTFNELISGYSHSQLHELQRWADEGAIQGTSQTICDVRRFVEGVFGVASFSNKEILQAIKRAGGSFTSRMESDIGDYCFVDLDSVIGALGETKKV